MGAVWALCCAAQNEGEKESSFFEKKEAKKRLLLGVWLRRCHTPAQNQKFLRSFS
jgi:hypothetical protein